MSADSAAMLSGDHRLFRWAATAALATAASSAAVFALLDAATIANRLSGETVDARPMWLHTFAIALLTCAVVAHARWFQTNRHSTVARIAYLAIAAVNVTVPVLALARPQDALHIVVPAVHWMLAGLLLTMAILAKGDSHGTPHTAQRRGATVLTSTPNGGSRRRRDQ